MRLDRIVVVGASAAGLAAAEALRKSGFVGALTIVGDERDAPYDRPPLSKQILRGSWRPERLALRDQQTLDGLNAQWVLGVAAVSVDTEAHEVGLVDGRELPFDGLVIATGVTPKRLPFGHDLSGVHVLRTLSDAMCFRESLLASRSVVVVGAGFLGSEAAAAAREMGLDVTLVDPLPAPMIRQLGQYVSDRCAELHARHGVTVHCGVSVREIVGTDGRVSAVRLSDNSVVPAEAVLVAIGSIPATEWLIGSDLPLGNGVECDASCRAGTNVVAAGDVASWVHPGFGRMRVEHRMNATEQGLAAARTLLGSSEVFSPVPYFWSDQYDVRIQAYGMTGSGAQFRLVEERPGGGFAGLYGVNGRVCGALAWSMPRAARTLRACVIDRVPWPDRSLSAFQRTTSDLSLGHKESIP